MLPWRGGVEQSCAHHGAQEAEKRYGKGKETVYVTLQRPISCDLLLPGWPHFLMSLPPCYNTVNYGSINSRHPHDIITCQGSIYGWGSNFSIRAFGGQSHQYHTRHQSLPQLSSQGAPTLIDRPSQWCRKNHQGPIPEESEGVLAFCLFV